MIAVALLLACAEPPDVPLPSARDPVRRRHADRVVAADLLGVTVDGELVTAVSVLPKRDDAPAIREALGDADRVRLDLHPELSLAQALPLLGAVHGFDGDVCARRELDLSVQGGALRLAVAEVADLLADPLGPICPTSGRLAGAPQVQLLPDGVRVRVRADGQPRDTLVASVAAVGEVLGDHEGPVVVVPLSDGTVQDLVGALDVLRHDVGVAPEILVGIER